MKKNQEGNYNFGEMLKDLRISLNLTQQALGDIIGESKVSICRWEKGNIHKLKFYGIIHLLVKKFDL